jgi:hypothetical protein
MTTACAISMDEICVLISAQIDMLEDPAPLTSEQWAEFYSRAERIRMLCREIDPMEREDFTPQPEMESLGESSDYPMQDAKQQPFLCARRRLRCLPQTECAEDQEGAEEQERVEDLECIDFAKAV